MCKDSISLHDGGRINDLSNLVDDFVSSVENLEDVKYPEISTRIPTSNSAVRAWRSACKPLQVSLTLRDVTTESRVQAKFFTPLGLSKDDFLDVMTESAKIVPPSLSYMDRVWRRLAEGSDSIMSGISANKAEDTIARLVQERAHVVDVASVAIDSAITEKDAWKQVAQEALAQISALTAKERSLTRLLSSSRELVHTLKDELDQSSDELSRTRIQSSTDEATSKQIMTAHVHMYSAAASLISQFPPLPDLLAGIKRSLKVDKYEVPIDDITIYIYVSMLTGVPLDAVIDELFAMVSKSKTHVQILTRVARKLLYNEQPTPLLPAVDRAVSKYLRECEPKELGEEIHFKDVSPAAVIVSLCLPQLADLVLPLHRPVCDGEVVDTKERATRAQIAVKELLRYTLLSGATVPQRFELPKMPDTTQWAYFASEWAKFVYVGDHSDFAIHNTGDAVPTGATTSSTEDDAPVPHS